MCTTYLDQTTWNALADLISTHRPLREALGIRVNPADNSVGFDEVADVLGGVFDIWPEWARAVIEGDSDRIPI